MRPLFNILLLTYTFVSVATSAPQQAPPFQPETASTTAPPPPSPPTSTPPPPSDNCGPGQECDCSRFPDKNSEAYFDCITDPNCEHCWVTEPAPSATPAPTATVTAPPNSDPGTTMSSTPTVQIIDFTTTTTATSSSSASD